VKPPLALGTVVKPWGRIVAVANGGALGERYYFLRDTNPRYRCIVSMVPADVVEPAGRTNGGTP
jgi:hypothetical protein